MKMQYYYRLALILAAVLNEVLTSRISRVAIVGAGPGGLSLATALKRLPSGVQEIIVYDTRADITNTAIGGGVQISGGAKVCELLGILPELDAIAEKFERVIARNPNGDVLLSLNLQESVRRKEIRTLISANGDPLLYSIMRSSLQQILYKAATSSVSSSKDTPRVKIRTGVNVNEIKKTTNGKYSISSTSSRSNSKQGGGSSIEDDNFDMIFGCDGVKSVVRDYIYRDTVFRSPLVSAALNPRYSGIRVGFVLTKPDKNFQLRPNARGAFHQWFGDGAYALEASYGSQQGPTHGLAVVYKDSADALLGVNPDWAEKPLIQQFQRRLEASGLYKVDEIRTILQAADPSRCVDIGVREALIPLPQWASDDRKVVLLGDSAHAMAPFLGQGVNQALQDAYVLAKGITDINASDDSAVVTGNQIKSMIKTYEDKRKGFTSLLRAKSSILGFVETLGGQPGILAKENFFRFSNFAGIAENVFLSAATPKL